MDFKFEKFQAVCRFMQFGVINDSTTEFEPTCRRADRIPEGSSWGVCNEQHCPYFGIVVKTGALYINQKLVMNVKDALLVLAAESE